MKTEIKNHPLKPILKAGVPLAAFETADPKATIIECTQAAKETPSDSGTRPVIQWDCVEGVVGVNEEGTAVAQNLSCDKLMPLDAVLSLVAKLETQNVLFFLHNAHLFIKQEVVLQGVWNLRDAWKSMGSTCVLLCPAFKAPEELRHDIVTISEPLPEINQLREIVDQTLQDAEIEEDEGKVEKTSTTLLGCSAFAAEQFCAMSLSKSGIDIAKVAEYRRNYIGQLPGIEIRNDNLCFNDIAGYTVIKGLFKLKMNGKRPPQIIVWWDELEKAISASGSDMSGVTQDQIGVLLTWLQDRLNQNRLSAVLLVGFPGTSKSMFAMALRNEAGCECVRMDFGGMKDSLVGGSEQRIRAALKGIDAIGGGQILVVATCNNAANLPSALTSRFALGTYFFDLPTDKENESIWKIKRGKYNIASKDKTPDSKGWTGREINQCCFVADDLEIPLVEAAKYITPFVATGVKEIEALRSAANGRYLSASQSGMYRTNQPATSRKMSV